MDEPVDLVQKQGVKHLVGGLAGRTDLMRQSTSDIKSISFRDDLWRTD